MTFQFRFASLLRLREMDRELASISLANIHQAIDDRTRELDAVVNQREQLRTRRREIRSGVISVAELKLQEDMDAVLVASSRELRQQISVLESERAAQQQRLAERQQEVAKYETLLRNDRSKFQRKFSNAQQQELDEYVSRQPFIGM